MFSFISDTRQNKQFEKANALSLGNENQLAVITICITNRQADVNDDADDAHDYHIMIMQSNVLAIRNRNQNCNPAIFM